MRELTGFKSHCIVKVGDEIFNFHFGYKKNTDGLFEIIINERPESPFSKSIYILEERKQKDGMEIIRVGEEDETWRDTEGRAMRVGGLWATCLVRLIKFDKDFNEEWGHSDHKIKIIRHRRLFQDSVFA